MSYRCTKCHGTAPWSRLMQQRLGGACPACATGKPGPEAAERLPSERRLPGHILLAGSKRRRGRAPS